MSYHIHICDYCKNGTFCDCGRINLDDITYKDTTTIDVSREIKRQTEDWITLHTDGLDYIARLNTAIQHNATEVDTCKDDIMSLAEWTAMGKTVWRATWLKTKLRLYSLLWIGR